MNLKYIAAPLAGLLTLACLTLSILAVPVQAAPPTVSIVAASEIEATTAKASGKVSPGGPETTYRFEYVEDEQFDDNEAAGLDGFAGAAQAGVAYLAASAGQTTSAVIIEGLASGARYHLRLVAENEDGVAVAVAPEFVTDAGAPPPPEPIPCFGDSCQLLPPEPVDPPLGTLAAGLGNPKVHYFRYARPRPHKHRRHKKKSGKHKSRAQKSAQR